MMSATAFAVASEEVASAGVVFAQLLFRFYEHDVTDDEHPLAPVIVRIVEERADLLQPEHRRHLYGRGHQ